MKFRYKVLLINIVLLSVALGVIGFLMIDKNFTLAMDNQIENAIDENNFIQSAIEYQLLDAINDPAQAKSSHYLTDQLSKIGSSFSTGMSLSNFDIFIILDGTTIYSNTPESSYPEILWKDTKLGQKNYVLTHENKNHYIYTTSCNLINEKKLNIINKKDITSAYSLLQEQASYYRFLIILVLVVCSVLMFIISTLLTKPMEQLNKISNGFANGHYDLRASIHSKDEIGELADTYNDMAESVSNHVQELKDLITQKEQFVADFTHEIKTPMTAIIGYADTIRSKEMSRENQIMAASYIFSEGKRLENMSMKLFDLIYMKQHELQLRRISTGNLMEQIITSVTPILNAKSISLETEYENCYIKGDGDLLKSAFINIIDNARKASESGSKILFRGEIREQNFLISVQDFGIGIDAENLNRICNEFYMVDKSRSRQEGGAGLGLSLANLIFQKNDAQFSIESTVGVGTIMCATFNIIPEGDFTNE